MNILLTGATGFLGSHLLKKIINETDHNLIILKRSFSDTYRIADYINNKKILLYNIDKTKIANIFENNNIDVIIHCATNYGRNNSSSYEVLETNLMFPISLLDNAIKYNTKYFINTDSYFNKENFSYSYLLNYSLSKKSILLWLKNFSKKIQVANMVLEHMFGENDSPNKFVSKMIYDIAINKLPSVDLTYGDQKRDFIYIDDVTSAYIKVIDHMKNHKWNYRNFDIGTGKAVSIKDFVSEIKRISNSNTILNFGKIPYREDEIMISYADVAELEDIGFKCKYNYKSGLTKTIEAMIHNK